MKYLILFLLLLLSGNVIYAQSQFDIDFEDPSLPGPQMDYTQTIDTGDYYFDYYYQGPWGDYNRFYGRKNADSSFEGFTYSNIRDSVSSDITNNRAAFPAMGNNGSDQYAVGHGECGAHMSQLIGMRPTLFTKVFGLYITNTTRSVLSMEHGDSIAKKFGGVTGNDPDWFLLNIKGYYYFTPDSVALTDSVLFYLADFRSDTSAMDYIIKDWAWVDLSSLGEVDSLSFSLSSSDTNQSGVINTPAYFCIDDIGIEGGGGIHELYANGLFQIYPNPINSDETLFVEQRSSTSGNQYEFILYNLSGNTVLKKKVGINNLITLPSLPSGIYTVLIRNKQQQVVYTQKLIVR